jgi:hypothetical protein
MSIIQVLAASGPRPSADASSASLRAALPFSEAFGFVDQSLLIRGSGSTANVVNYFDAPASNAISIQTAQSKFYGSSGRKPIGANDNVFRESHVDINTGTGTAAGTGDFCYEFWMYSESFTPPTGINRLGILFPLWRLNNANTYGYIPRIDLFGGTLRVLNPEETITIAQTGAIFATNTWYHIAITRSGSTVRIFVDGVQQASGSSSVNFTGYEYWFFDSTRWYPFGFYFQDLRVYTGTAKFTSTFTPPGAMFV